jgi:hypothetical protein
MFQPVHANINSEFVQSFCFSKNGRSVERHVYTMFQLSIIKRDIYTTREHDKLLGKSGKLVIVPSKITHMLLSL